MKNRKGLTLIEVILSLAILGIISVGFLTAISGYFKFFTKTRQISREVFKTQQRIELAIDDVKENIINQTDPPVPDEIKRIEIWGEPIDVEYYEVEENYNDKIYATLISNIKPKVEKQLKLSDIGIKIKQVDKQVPYAYGTGEFSIIGNFENYYDPSDISTMRDHLRNVIEWYASSEEFNMPAPVEIASEEDLYYYPTFPKDYLIVENDSNDGFGNHDSDNIKLPNLEHYKGRNIIFTVTPGARSGRIGIQSESIPVFISGLPVTDNLVIHLDAAFINTINFADDETTPDGKVNKWYDLSSIIGKSKPDEVANSGSSKPQLKKTEMEEAFRGQYVQFNNQNQTLNLTGQGTNGKNIYVFAAIRNNTGDLDEVLFLTNTDENGSVEISIIPEGNQIGEWIIVKNFVDNARNNFKIGGPDVDIAEIAVYNSALSNGEIEEIENYFLSKYRTSIISD